MKFLAFFLLSSIGQALAADIIAKDQAVIKLTSADRIIFPNLLSDSNGDGFIKSSKRKNGNYIFRYLDKNNESKVVYVSASTLMLIKGKAYGLTSYGEAPAPVVVTPPPTPAPSVTSVMADRNGEEVFVQGKFLNFGVNEFGGLGTAYNAPGAFYTNIKSGLLRIGLNLDVDGFKSGNETPISDALLQGRAIEGFTVNYKLAGKPYSRANAYLTGYTQVKGHQSLNKLSGKAEVDFAGETAEAVEVRQKLSFSGASKFIVIDVELINRSGKDLEDVRYMRSYDPDQSDKFVTANKIVEQGSGVSLVSAGLPGTTAQAFLYSNDARSSALIHGFVDIDGYMSVYDKSQAKGYAKNSDETLRMIFKLGKMSHGQSKKLRLFIGVTDNLDATLKEMVSLK